MWTRLSTAVTAVLFILFDCGLTVPQQLVPVPYVLKDSFVLEFAEPYMRLGVEAGENQFSTFEIVEIAISEGTVFIDHKNKPIPRAALRPGMRVEIQAEKVGGQINARVVRIKTKIDPWEVEVKGLFDKLNGDVAKIDGQSVKLSPGARIDGDSEWKGKKFGAFGEMMLGSLVEVSGIRKGDGIVYAQKGKTKPNLFTDMDRELIASVKAGIAISHPNGAADGRVKVGNTELKIVGRPEVNAYITTIGQKLVPQWAKDLQDDDPAKITFRFFVIEDDTFNAFALPDGTVVVNTGLLKVMKNEAQLAAILGHEIAHVTNEHSRKGLETAHKTGLIATGIGIIRGNKPDAIASTFGLGVLSNKLGRNSEDQADRVGLFYTHNAGYDPREAPKIWREMTKLIKEDAVSNFLYSDHSTAKARLQNLNREIAYNYYATDFANAVIGESDYKAALGRYFGWIKEPPAQRAEEESPAANRSTKGEAEPKATPKPTKKVLRKPKRRHGR